MRFEGQQSKDIVKDYLEGALDLEGSLVILSKLHRKLQKLKEVIRDSLVRQKLVENTESVEKATTAASQKAGKGPSLIAKLMGIEEYPSRPLQAALKKQFEEGEKTVSSQYLGNQLQQQSQSRNAHLRNVACNSTERKRNHLKKEYPAKDPKTKNVVSEESEKRIIMDYKSDASPIIAGLADENPKVEETDAFVSQGEWRYGLFELQELDYVMSSVEY
ncbi:hypothetical protein ACFX2I_026169 [Malus domestica]